MAWWERDKEYEKRIYEACVAEVKPVAQRDLPPAWTWEDVNLLKRMKIDPWKLDERAK